MKHSIIDTRAFVCVLFVITFLASGCDLLGSDEEDPVITTGVYVANQGNFSDGNGSVSIYDPITREVSSNAIANLGSIVQSVTISDGRLFVLANTADRIDVFDLETNEQIASIEGVVNPRYMAVASNGKAYVTSFYSAPGSFTGGMVTVIDMNSYTKVKEIEVGENPEGITISGNRVYVANYSSEVSFGGGTTLSVIDSGTDQVIDTLDIACDAPRFLVTDEEGEVFAFCTGQTLFDEQFNIIGETPGAVRVLDGPTGNIVESIDIDGRIETIGPGQDVYYVPETREIFAVKDARTLLRFDTRDNVLADSIGGFGDVPVGAVAFDARANRFYVGHVPGYVESGLVTIHERDGTQVDQFTAGISPTFILLHQVEE